MSFFLDIRNAYHSVICSLVADDGESDEILEHIVHTLKLPPDPAQEMFHICQMLPAARAAHPPEHQHFSNTWLNVQDATGPAEANSGTQPGVPDAADTFI